MKIKIILVVIFIFILLFTLFGCKEEKPTEVVEEKEIVKVMEKVVPKPIVETKKEVPKPIVETKKEVPKTIPVESVPEASKKILPILKDTINNSWKTITMYSLFAGQVEQETCITLKHKKCWNPHAELNTSREYGFGLGQITISYNAQGKERFNNFLEIKRIDKTLSKWEWKDRYNPNYQLRALISLNKYNYNLIKWDCATEKDKYAFMLSSYNGGLGGVIKDRQICAKTAGCDSSKWFNNVEKTSYKAKTAVSGYGKSFFEINREYVQNVLNKRRFKYIPYLGS